MTPCPRCEKALSWRQRWRFTTLWETRRTAPCPGCGAPLRWAAGPWRAIHAVLLALLLVSWGRPFVRELLPFGAFVLVTLLLVVGALHAGVSQRLEVVEAAKAA